ncbi:MAG: hypothetical protein AMXMBFR33_35470 [Candidatus Xenobia bacterium]
MVVLGVAAVLAIFTGAIGANAAMNLRSVTRQSKVDQAHYAAYTGVQISMSCIKEPPVDPVTGVVIPWLETDPSIIVQLRDNVSCTARTYHNIEGLNGRLNTADDGTNIPPNCFYIVSVGSVSQTVSASSSSMGAIVAPLFPVIDHAVFGSSLVQVNGLVDHFDSAALPPAINPACTIPGAPVGTNATAAASLQVGAAAHIDGNLHLGAGAPTTEADALTALLAGGLGTGTSTVLGTPKAMPNAVRPDTATALVPSSGGFTLDGGRSYYVAGDMVLDNAQIQINGSGNAVLFVNGNITITNSPNLTPPQRPERLKIFCLDPAGTFSMTGSTGYFVLAGNGNFQAMIGSSTPPGAGLLDSQLYGAVLADSVTVNEGSAVHFDVALADPARVGSVGDFFIISMTSSGGQILPQNVLTAPPAGGPLGATGTAGGTGTATGTAAGTTTGAAAGTTTGTAAGTTTGTAAGTTTGTAAGTTTGTTSGTTTGTTGTATGGCGCGCGGGSMMMSE